MRHPCAVHCPRGGDWSWLLMGVLILAGAAALAWVAVHAVAVAVVLGVPAVFAVVAAGWLAVASHGRAPWLPPVLQAVPVHRPRALTAAPKALPSPAAVTVLASRFERRRDEVPEPAGVQALPKRRVTSTGGQHVQ